MSRRHAVIKLAAVIALGVPAAAVAQDSGFSYLEGGFITSFVNDVEDSGVIAGPGSTPQLEADAGGGGFIVRPDLALVAGYEFGKITTVNVGVRFSF